MANGMGRRRLAVLLLAPLLVSQASAPDVVIIAQLRFARAMLCGNCNNDLEREGVNRTARRSMIGADKLATAREMLDDAPALPGAAAAQRHIARALAHLDDLDEAAAMHAIDAAIAALRRR